MTTPPLDPRDSLPPEDWMVCTVCHRVLEKYDAVENGRVVGYEWFHPFDMRQEGESHEPVPVMRKDLAEDEIAERCDFCLDEGPTWVLPVENFQEPFGVSNPITGGRDVLMSHSDWTACDTCGELIRKGYWDRLTRRAIKASKDRTHLAHYPPEAELFIKMLYREISRHVTGPLRPRGSRRSWGST